MESTEWVPGPDPQRRRVAVRSKRRLYRDGLPTRLARLLNRGWAIVHAAGILLPNRLVTVEVPGRRTGRPISLPLVVADYQGDRYLVAMLARTPTGCATSTRHTDRWCCAMAAANTCDSRRSTLVPGRPSCAGIWPWPRGPGRICRWTGAPL